MPRKARAVVADLYALLRAARIPGPYVLVGHSAGGLFVRLYASTYPRDVVRNVLVDAIGEQIKPLLGTRKWPGVPAAGPRQPPAPIAGYRDLEYLRWDVSFDEMRRAAAARPLRPMPLTVLSHGRPFELPAGFPPGFSPVLERARRGVQDQLSRLGARRAAHDRQAKRPLHPDRSAEPGGRRDPPCGRRPPPTLVHQPPDEHVHVARAQGDAELPRPQPGPWVALSQEHVNPIVAAGRALGLRRLRRGGIRTLDPRVTRVSRRGERRVREGAQGQEIAATCRFRVCV
jgi:pimeloyl-ACP methyl ester carboxylesterase